MRARVLVAACIAVGSLLLSDVASGTTPGGNGTIGAPSGGGFGVANVGTVTFGQGIFLQATNYSGSLANNTLMGNGND